jgi:hypothetical protein
MEKAQLKSSFLCVICSLFAYVAVAAPPETKLMPHPIVGKWTWTRDTNNCTEVYDYRPNGTLYVTSGAEIATVEYSISGHKDANGFYELKGLNRMTNGAQDCSDSPPEGEAKPYTIYIIFHLTQPLHVVCYTPALEQCFGPLKRVE